VRMHAWVPGNSTVVWAINPDAWGDDRTVIGENVFQPIVFAGQYRDAETAAYLDDDATVIRPGLVLNGHRTYDPFTGSYLQLDPLVKDTWSPYTYADDNPVGKDDPSGLATKTCRTWSCGAGSGGDPNVISVSCTCTEYEQESTADFSSWNLGRTPGGERTLPDRSGGGGSGTRVAAPKRQRERNLSPMLDALKDRESPAEQDRWWTQCLYDIQEGMSEKNIGKIVTVVPGTPPSSRNGGATRQDLKIELGWLAT